MMQIHKPKVTASPPGKYRSFKEFPVLAERYSNTPMFSPYPKDDTAMDTAIIIWNKVISHTCLFQNIIGERDPKFTSALCKNLHNLLGKKSLFSKAYHPQADDLEERMIQTL
ncbi:hypothetical protein O181_019405 [Austropuccinia psidii MF-1]|uniref:Integrase catalytic domain-containing protein n=1 Tax=Austropuccinia psidii MF-1 TaxID=1389203 RepID=A0A9Q3CAJ6_9BASI|nr:hypothetical protein [Austropuccinia psidii MF-1]